MKSFIKSYSYLLCAPLVFAGFFGSEPAFSKGNREAFDRGIIVLASSSMTNAFHEILEDFSSSQNISVSATFESSTELAREIEEGEAANIFISEDVTKLRDLQRLGMLNVFSFEDIVSDTLVFVVPKGHFLKRRLEKIENIEEKLRFIAKNSILVVPDPDIDPAGRYIMQVFQNIGEEAKVKSKMLRAANTRNALYLIANGNNAGIIYNSDVNNDPVVEVLFTIPAKYHDNIIYQAAMVAELDEEGNAEDSHKLIEYLKTDAVQEVFMRHGFIKAIGKSEKPLQ